MPENLNHQELKYYAVWDLTTRWFHWLNVICVIVLVGIGIVILNDKALGVSNDGKILLKTLHVYVGYVFVFNLIWRIIWGFIGNKFSRWQAILPINKGYWLSLRNYITGVKAGETYQYLGHNPAARLMVSLLFVLLTIQALTGLVLAGTDLYMPPFGHEIEQWVAVSDEHQNSLNLKPGSKDNIDADAYAKMREFRKPFVITHLYSFYMLLIAIILHIIAVVITEVREKNGLISAMITGKKVADQEPVDF